MKNWHSTKTSRQIKSMFRDAEKQSKNLYAAGFAWNTGNTGEDNSWIRVIDAKTIHGLTSIKSLANGEWYNISEFTKFDIR